MQGWIFELIKFIIAVLMSNDLGEADKFELSSVVTKNSRSKA